MTIILIKVMDVATDVCVTRQIVSLLFEHRTHPA